MATSKTDGTTSSTTTPPPVPADLDERFSALAAVRIASLASAAKIDAAKLRTLKLEHARLSARFGADSPKLAAIASSFDTRVAAVQTTGIDVERARVVPVPIDAGALTVTGRVVDKTGKGVGGASVVATDAAGKHVASATSDAAGRYHVKVPAKAAAAEGDRSVGLHATARGGGAHAHPRRLPCDGGVIEIIELLVED